MAKTKPTTDELGLAKSAAWAWYERGSGADGRSLREVDTWRGKTDRKPSRYKLEALRNVQAERNNNSLLDSYEVERISKHLQCYIESSRDKLHCGGGGVVAEGKRVEGRKKKKGWLRGGPVCGSSSDDVVENRSVGRRRPEKGRVVVVRPAVGVVSCRQ